MFVGGRRDLLRASAGGAAALLSGCVGGAAEGGDATGEDADAPTDDRDVRVIGHRGCADQYPENTVFAVGQAAPHVDAVEIDVQRCGSGELVVFHDDGLSGLTDAEGSVSTTDWETLRDLTVAGSDEPIPRLSDLLAAVPADTAVNVELKHEGMAADVLVAVEAVDNDVLVSSFVPGALREVRDRDGTVPLAFIIADSPEIGRSIALDLDCAAIHPATDLVLGTEFVERAHDDGLDVNAWTVEDAETARTLVDAGVDGLIADRWDLL